MKLLLFMIAMWMSIAGNAAIYKHIKVGDRLDNCGVLCIQKDGWGYLWFLTHESIIRYDGENLKEYFLNNTKGSNGLSEAHFFLDTQKRLWVIDGKGSLNLYDRDKDRFEEKVNFYPFIGSAFQVCYLDNKDIFWIGNGNKLYYYPLGGNKIHKIGEWSDALVTDVVQTEHNNYAIGTTKGICFLTLDEDIPSIQKKGKEVIFLPVKKLFYHPMKQVLLVVTGKNDIYLYHWEKGKPVLSYKLPFNLSVNKIKCFGKEEVLIATDGTGIHKMNIANGHIRPFIKVGIEEGRSIRSDIITDLLVDNKNRIWMADYPYGVTVRDERYSPYKWYGCEADGRESLINNHVNAILEDSEGDLWFATNNGISVYDTKTKKWQSLLYHKNASDLPCNIFVSLCEIRPGIIWAANYLHGIFIINKEGTKISALPASQSYGRFIRHLYKDKEGDIWIGGTDELTCVQHQTGEKNTYKSLRDIQVILEKDTQNIWVGTAHGLYILNKKNRKITPVNLPHDEISVQTLYQDKDSLLYIGTQKEALFIYDLIYKKFKHYTPQNSNLVSRHIYHLLPGENGNIFMSTEQGLAWFNSINHTFCNWTRDRGLKGENFNITSGIKRKNGNLIFGSCEGAIEFGEKVCLPRTGDCKINFEAFKLFDRPVLPGEKDSPLKKGINQTDTLVLEADQNWFSFKISSVDHDYPTDILYSWILKGHDKEWNKPSKNPTIHYAGLAPGKYLLGVRLISKERKKVIQERSMLIIVRPSFWKSAWGMFFYLVAALLMIREVIRHYRHKKEETLIKAENNYFMEIAQDIRNPLNLIVNPLENLCDQSAPENVKSELRWVLYHVKQITRQIGSLANFEKPSLCTGNFTQIEHELTFFIDQVIQNVIPYARQKEITITYKKDFEFASVYMDPYKVGPILKGLLLRAIKYAQVGDDIYLNIFYGDKEWGIEIPDQDRTSFIKLYKKWFRIFPYKEKDPQEGSINLLLIKRLLSLQRGKLEIIPLPGGSRKLKVVFPVEVGCNRYSLLGASVTALSESDKEEKDTIYVIEKEESFRAYLENCLSQEYRVVALSDGLEALELIREKEPDLVLSGIKIEGISGDKLCARLKADMRTAHIPVILLTVLSSDEDYWAGMRAGADEYIVKPCNIFRLKADMAGLIANRRALKKKYVKMLFGIELNEKMNVESLEKSESEWVAKVKRIVEECLPNVTFTIDVLCDKIGMSRSSFYVKWKSLTGEAPKDYILRVKMETAAKLLASRQYTVTEVADKVGFNDSKYFREVFKKYYGTSPLNYIRTL